MRYVTCLIFFWFSLSATAVDVSVSVASTQGTPVNQVVVFVEPLDGKVPETTPRPAIMDQVNKQFVPHILVVQRGSKVSFPNSDSIKHHVYSFSAAKSFELPLYKGQEAPPVSFDKAGEVAMGCNIHDWMLGYVLVVDTPYFGKTGEQGSLTLDIPPGNYRVNIWHPRIQDPRESLSQTIDTGVQTSLSFVLTKSLLEDLGGYENAPDPFADYD